MTRMFRLLKADEIECRVSQISKDKPAVSLLLYKTARTDANLLDETVGAMDWQDDYQVIDGTLYCRLSLWDKDKEQWITKTDAGTESYTEKEKGRASDAFKRAGFKWGIGRELYSAPNIWVNAEIKEFNGRRTTWDRFSVKDIGYNDKGEINKLVIINQKGKEVYTMGDIQEHVPSESTLKAKLKMAGIQDYVKLFQEQYNHNELEEFTNEEKRHLESRLDATIKKKKETE